MFKRCKWLKRINRPESSCCKSKRVRACHRWKTCLFAIILQRVVDQTRLKQISRQSSCRCRPGHLRKHLKQVVNRSSSCHFLPAPSETSAQHLISPETETLAAHLRNEKIYIQHLADNQLLVPGALSSRLFIALCVFFIFFVAIFFFFIFCRYPTSGLTDGQARSRTPASVIFNTQHLRFIQNTLKTLGWFRDLSSSSPQRLFELESARFKRPDSHCTQS